MVPGQGHLGAPDLVGIASRPRSRTLAEDETDAAVEEVAGALQRLARPRGAPGRSTRPAARTPRPGSSI